jgi:acyl-CoA synthetase (AMP-forming)/AMP-acid ligase II
VIAARDERRGETVKAVVVLREAFKGQVSEQEIVDWAHEPHGSLQEPADRAVCRQPAQIGHRQGAVARIAGAGAAYGQHFDDAGFQPIEH